MQSGKRILIFGATSAIAEAAARLWVQRGATLTLVGRSAAKLEAAAADLRVRATDPTRVVAIQADLDLLDRHADLVEQARARMGGIDIALIAHGSLPDQAACQRDPALALREIHTNGISAVHLASLLANVMVAQGHGTIAVISSVAGDRGRQSNYVYGSAKGLVSLFLQGLRNQLNDKGVHVVTVKPGFVDTPMTAGIAKKGPLWATPETVAAGIVRAIDQQRDVVYLPGFWRFIMMPIRAIPERMFKRMKL